MMAVVMVAQTGPQGNRGRGLVRLKEGNWHQERISPEFGQELLPEPVLPPFTWASVLVTPIEFHSDFKHISTFYGVNLYDFKIWLRMSPLSQ